MSPPVAISSNIATGGDIGVLLGCKRASAEKSKSILTFPFLSLSFFAIRILFILFILFFLSSLSFFICFFPFVLTILHFVYGTATTYALMQQSSLYYLNAVSQHVYRALST